MTFPDSIPLTGSDYFHVFLDRHMRKYCATGNIGRLRIDVNGRITSDHFRTKGKLLNILTSLRYEKKWMFSIPKWITVKNAIININQYETADIPQMVFDRDININIPPLIHIDLIYPSEDTTIVVLSWHHALMDARGAELLLKAIGENSGSYQLTSIENPVNKSILERLQISKEAKATIVSATPERIASALKSTVAKNPQLKYFTISFSSEETSEINLRSKELGLRFGLSPFYLAATTRALSKTLSTIRKGEAFWVPIPQDQRLKGASGPIISNQVSFLFYQLNDEHLNDLKKTIAAISSQMVEQIRSSITKKYFEFMDLFKILPISLYAYFAKGPTKGKLASFFFSDTGDSLKEFSTFFDFPVTDAWHFPPNIYPPGFTVIFTKFQDKLKVVIGFTEENFSEMEIENIKGHIKKDLIG